MAIACVDDLRRAAKRRLPKVLFDYIDGGAFSEQTVNANTRDFDAWLLEQRVLASVEKRGLQTMILGKQRALPFLLGPIGFLGLFTRRGEILAARAAHAAGVPFCLSNFGIATLEEVRAATDGSLWFQLYLITDRALVESFIGRAEGVGVEALCITVDCAVSGVRERDIRSGFRAIEQLTPKLAMSLLSRPRWCLGFAGSGMPSIGHLSDRPEFGRGALQQAKRLGGKMDANMNWGDVRRIRDRWHNKLIVKGILHVEDARKAVEIGADAIVVSNHGGRELDGAPSTISILPEIVAAVGDRVEVMMDGGVRRGTHIVKALALGARGVLLGRAYAFGLAAAGQTGVTQVINFLSTELDITMAHMGVASISELFIRRGELLRSSVGGRRH